MKACIGPRGSLLNECNTKTTETVHEGHKPNCFDYWADRPFSLIFVFSTVDFKLMFLIQIADG